MYLLLNVGLRRRFHTIAAKSNDELEEKLKWYRIVPLSGEEERLADQLATIFYTRKINVDYDVMMAKPELYYPQNFPEMSNWNSIVVEAYFQYHLLKVREQQYKEALNAK